MDILDINRSTYYYRIENQDHTRVQNGGRPIPGYSVKQDGTKVCDEQIKEWIIHLIETEAFAYGYRKLTCLLERRFNMVINYKKVYRLCDEMDILRPQRKIQAKYPKRIAINREITASNQLLETDLKYGYIKGEDRFFYVLSYLDIYDRSIVDYHIGLSCESKDAVFTLRNALGIRGINPKKNSLIIRSDNGPQFISHLFDGVCEELKVEHERIPNKTPNKNAHIESFHRLLEDECLGINEFKHYGEAYRNVAEYMHYYNNVRIHSAIKYLPPMEYYLSGLQGLNKPMVIKV